uniref:ARAD1D22880p n=1 Tax=Blastobotrys adeninivorans TaxID=409370 RepID=A0A060TGE2_BLAAD
MDNALRIYDMDTPTNDQKPFDGFAHAQSPQHYLNAPATINSTDSGGGNPQYSPMDISSSSYFDVSPLLNVHDTMALHYLVQKSIADAKGYRVLSYQELDEAMNESKMLHSRLSDLDHKISMETKLRDAAASLQKLHMEGSPSSPNSGSSSRRSFRISSGSSSKRRLSRHAEEEYEVSNRKIQALETDRARLQARATELDLKILHHHVGVLALTHPGSQSASAQSFESHLRQLSAGSSTTATMDPHSHQQQHPPNSHHQQANQQRISDSHMAHATSRMINQRMSGSLGSSTSALSSRSIDESDATVDSIISMMSSSLASPTTSPRSAPVGEKLPFLSTLTQNLVSQHDALKGQLASRDQYCGELQSIIKETVNELDPSIEISSTNPSELRNASQAAIQAVRGNHSSEKEQLSSQLDQSRFEHQSLLAEFERTKLEHEENMNANDKSAHVEQLQQELEQLKSEHQSLKLSATNGLSQDRELSTSADAVGPSDSAEGGKVKSLLKQQLDTLSASYDANCAELERLEVENVNLKTQLRDLRFKTEAEMQELQNELKANQERVTEWKERCDTLRSELESVVRSLEDVTRQSVEYESERVQLESKVEELQKKLFEDSQSNLDKRVSRMEVRGLNMSSPDLSADASSSSSVAEPTSVTLLRHEFRRIIMDLNTKHSKELKREQQEKKKMENLLRSIKRSSYMANLPPGKLESFGIEAL